LVGIYNKEVDPVHKVSILPRGRALGYTMHLPVEDRYLTTRNELMARMATLLGGRVAEDLIFGDVTTGAQSDLERITDVAHKMVCQFGMSDKLGPLTFGLNENQVFLGRDFYKDREYSEEIAFEIDKEVRQIVDECYHRARTVLEANRDVLDALAKALLEREVLTAEEVKKIIKEVETSRTLPTQSDDLASLPTMEAVSAVSEEQPLVAGEN